MSWDLFTWLRTAKHIFSIPIKVTCLACWCPLLCSPWSTCMFSQYNYFLMVIWNKYNQAKRDGITYWFLTTETKPPLQSFRMFRTSHVNRGITSPNGPTGTITARSHFVPEWRIFRMGIKIVNGCFNGKQYHINAVYHNISHLQMYTNNFTIIYIYIFTYIDMPHLHLGFISFVVHIQMCKSITLLKSKFIDGSSEFRSHVPNFQFTKSMLHTDT